MSYDLMSKSKCKHPSMAIHGHNRPVNRSYPSRNNPSSIQISSADVDHDSDFNFNCPKLDRCASLDNPLSESYDYDSPADRLFVNGVISPHQFPIPRSNTQNSHHGRLMMSYTGSGESSIGGGSSSASTRASSLASSRSSSTDGGSSHSSFVIKTEKRPRGRRGTMSNHKAGRLTEGQRWQVIATPVPGMGSKEKATAHHCRRAGEAGDRLARKKSEGFFQGLLSTCKSCHALEVPRKDNVVLRGGNNITSTTIY